MTTRKKTATPKEELATTEPKIYAHLTLDDLDEINEANDAFSGLAELLHGSGNHHYGAVQAYTAAPREAEQSGKTGEQQFDEKVGLAHRN